MMWCIVGLGNPGAKYESTPHNVGFELIDRLSLRWKIPVNQSNPLFHFGSGDFNGIPILLVKPMTYMNRSGAAYKRLMSDEAFATGRSLILLDDIHLDFGKLRLRKKGSEGGHNGLKHIIQVAQTKDIPRLRIGVGGNEEDWIDHVLSPFSKRERENMDETLDRAEEAVETMLLDGFEKAMNLFNR